MTTAFTAIPVKITISAMRLRGGDMNDSYPVLNNELAEILTMAGPGSLTLINSIGVCGDK